MGRKTQIAVIVAVLVVVVGVAGAYAYDSSQKDKIADGVHIAGVDVGGLSEDEATTLVRRRLLAPLRQSLRVSFDGQSWKLPGTRLKVRADVDQAVEEAVAESQEGGLPGRLVRYVTGGEVTKSISPRVTYSERTINRFVRRVADEINREPRNADVEPSAASLEVVAGRNGRKLRDNQLTKDLNAAVLSATAPHTIVAAVHSTKPEVTKQEVAAEYPSYLTLDRGSFTLRLWEHLKLAKTYTVAVGQEGLETPEGLYAIQEKEENPSWHVPDSAWAGDLAGQVIPPGPADPIKARWMAIYEGAGIHGTEETESLGSAASHGCVRMSIPDVEELYDRVEVGTPIYIG
ncbi:MAG TPA: L,D-transpeptidase/peptidoglycan binding protein [Solirubrobacterales bacterium]|jgi:lipoprotein-anchoring transpeptidase ErfK/SrfK|nr:L,D-transpeptidase/peptidoglycan binding protein [Solirubrobacterales bacterium]